MKKLCYSFILLVSFLSATIINVPDDYSTIQAGINASDNGDTVLIAQGIYFENLILQKEIVLTSNAIYDDLDSDFHNNENINETIISGPPEPDDPSKGSCLVIRYGDIEPTIFGLTFQDGLGTSMIEVDCGTFPVRSGGAILIYEAYPTIMYNRFLNNGGGENTGGNVVASVANGGAISHYDTDDVEFDEDRNSSSQDNNSSRTYVNGNPATEDDYNNEKKLQKIQGNERLRDVSSSKEQVPSLKELEEMLAIPGYPSFVPEVRDDDDFVPRVRSDLIIYMYDSYGDGWNGNVLTIGEHTFTLQNGEYGEETLSLDDGYYTVTCDGGSWQDEVSWQIVDAADGTELLAGGAPYEGGFDLGGDPVSDTLFIQNNYFEGNSSGNGENVYSKGYEGDIDVSGSVFEDIDCETNTVNEFVLQSIENAADYIQNDISGVCIESNSFYVSGIFGDDSNDGTEEAPLKTIGHALTLVRDAEIPTTIYLNAGVYSPSTNGEKFPIILPDNVHLVGDESENTFLDAEASANDQAAVMIIKEVEDVRVANLTLTGGSSEGHGCTGGGGLLITADEMADLNSDYGNNFGWNYVVIENVIIENNESHNGGGLSIFRSRGSIVRNTIIRNNAASTFGGGVFTYGSHVNMTNVTVTGNNNLAGTEQGGGMMMPVTGGTLDSMTITDNEGCCGGAGVWTNGNNCTWTMTNSIISGNSGNWGAGLAVLGGDSTGAEPTLINVTISDNTASGNGGAVWSNGASPTFENCTITGNTALADGMGGTFWLLNEGDPSLTDCLISGNTAPYATAGIWSMSVTTLNLTRVTIADNSGEWNPGVFISDAYDDGSHTPATLTNCTITGNSSSNGGSIRATYGGHIDVINSIIWDNATPAEVSIAGGSVDIIYSDIDGGWDGEGNIDDDPLFTDANSGDYTITDESPCKDAGTADTDGDGEDDITDYNGSAPDMGAFEITLPVITGFTFYTFDTYISLTWDPTNQDGFQYYLLERSTDEEFAEDIVSNYVTINYYEDNEMEYDTEYFYRVSYYTNNWSEYSEVISVTLQWLDVDGEQLPTVYALHQNYPNPFNPTTQIKYDLPEDAMVSITIYDIMGRSIRSLVNSQQTAGYRSIQWNATNNLGELLSAGMYIYTIQAGEFSQTRKMILLK